MPPLQYFLFSRFSSGTSFCFLVLLFSFSLPLSSQTPKPTEYSDGRGGKVLLPQGDISFADEVVSFTVGDPEPIAGYMNPKQALGPPNWKGDTSGFVTLGCGGVLVLKFTDNALVNIDGPDLFVFEVGKYIEPTMLSISKDGKKWIEVGEIQGGTAAVDIGDSVKTGEKFNYIKLTDLKSECGGMWPGADIDAVAAIGTGMQINLNSSILFNSGSFVLRPEAKAELQKVIVQVQGYTGVQIVIEGHTDNVGTPASNLVLSDKRAKAVNDFFENGLKGKKLKLNYYGYGDQYPVAPNDTKQGQEKNRRVELVILPLK
jgi:OOP family OmpA-OmpF porin